MLWRRGASQGVVICRLQELKLLEEDANVYKLVGPVLVKQDLVEAKANVNKRLEFIKGEIERVEQQLTKLQDKQSKRQQQVGTALPSAACWEQAECRTCTAKRQRQVHTFRPSSVLGTQPAAGQAGQAAVAGGTISLSHMLSCEHICSCV